MKAGNDLKTKQALLLSRSIPVGFRVSMSFSRTSRLLIDTLNPTG